MLVASQRFRDCEFLVPKAFFEQAHIQVITTSTTKKVVGRFGYTFDVDIVLNDVKPENFDAVFFVGGSGSAEFLDNTQAQTLFKTLLDQNKPIAAICAAPRNFLIWGILRNKKCTGFDADGVFSKLAVEYGAIATPEKEVVIDGLILTANGPEASEACALAFIDLIMN